MTSPVTVALRVLLVTTLMMLGAAAVGGTVMRMGRAVGVPAQTTAEVRGVLKGDIEVEPSWGAVRPDPNVMLEESGYFDD